MGDAESPQWRTTALDASLALAAAVLTATGTFGSVEFFGPPLAGVDDRYPPLWVGLPLAALVAAATWYRRRLPLVFVAAALAANIVVTAQLVVMAALYSYAERTLARVRTGVITAIAAVLVTPPIWRFAGPDGGIPLGTACCLLPAVLGLYVGTRRALADRMRERADRAEREQQQRIARARSDERARIARDMHDVVTHRVALMVMHATAIEATGGSNALALSHQIGTIGREALTELRSLVEVLRSDDELPVTPQPGLAELEQLVESSRQLGLPVTIDVSSETNHRPSVLVEHAVYRVVQEALTNVHKHADGARTSIQVHHTSDHLRVTVVNGRGAPNRDAALPRGGHGLLGAAERVRLLGGWFHAGATADGGYELIAEIPVPREAG